MKRPNVLIVMSDQHHPRFMGCAGNGLVRTPAMDQLAQRGTHFARTYCTSPLSCPSRMSFMTARMPSSLNCLTNARQLDSDIPTFAHLFNAAGYETVLCGRMHFNGPDQRHGFSRRIAADVTAAYGKPAELLRPILGELSDTTGPIARAIRKSGPGWSGYLAYDQHIASQAAHWLAHRRDDRPFALVVGFVLPHAPFVAPPDLFDYYDARISEADLPPAHPLHPELTRLQQRAKLLDADAPSPKDQRRARVAYHGMCEFLDRQLSVVLNALHDAGLTDDTIVAYTSDHGETLGEHGMWWKHTFYESSVGVPLLIAGPGIPRHRVMTQNVSLMDLGPTFLDMTGCPPIPGAQGASFQCLLTGDTDRWHNTVHADNLWPPDAACIHRMIKRGPWKLNLYPGYEPQLFNLDEDPHELHDRAADPACRSLRAELTAAAAAAGWNPDRILANHRAQLAAERLTYPTLYNPDLPQPDPLWFTSPIANQFDPTR